MIKTATLLLAAMATTAAADCPIGQADAHLGIPITSADLGGTDGRQTYESATLGGTFCVIDHLELGGDYAFRLHPDASGSGLLQLHATYYAIKNAQMELGIAGALGFDFTGDTEVTLQGGAWFRYFINDQVALFTGQPALPILLAGTISSFLGLPPVENQLTIGINNSQPISLALPLGAMFTPVPEAHLMVATNIGDIWFTNGPADKHATLLFADFIPLAVAAWYDVRPDLQLGVQFADDLKHAGDFFQFTIAARFFLPH